MREGAIVGWSHDTFATGWFQVAWSAEIAIGQVVRRRYWSRDLVVWRGESGAVHVMDAREHRRGVDLSRWGRVEGDALVSVVDGWSWRPDGTAVTPAGTVVDGPATLRTFPVREVMNLIFVWYDEQAEPPQWAIEASPEAESPDYYPAWPHGTVMDTMSCTPQIMAENIGDAVHIHYMHRWNDIPAITRWDELGPRLEVAYEGSFPSNRGPVEAVIHNSAWGLGVMRTRMASLRRFVHYLCPTPIDQNTMDVRLTTWVERAEDDHSEEPDKLAKALIKAQEYEVLGPDVDRAVWENQAYLERAGFRSQERHFIQFRKWTKQFYPHEQAGVATAKPDAVAAGQ